jgi:hypothetical protein
VLATPIIVSGCAPDTPLASGFCPQSARGRDYPSIGSSRITTAARCRPAGFVIAIGTFLPEKQNYGRFRPHLEIHPETVRKVSVTPYVPTRGLRIMIGLALRARNIFHHLT